MPAGATPPDPGTNANFLNAVKACTYDGEHAALTDSTTGALKRPMLVAGASPGDVIWGADVPGTCPAFRLASFTYEMLCGGVLQTDGTLLYTGRSFRLRALVHTDGLLWADAVPT